MKSMDTGSLLVSLEIEYCLERETIKTKQEDGH